MKLFIGVTDNTWYENLKNIPDIDEVNFWQPSAHTFKVLQPGDIFLFKPHRPYRAIVGGGYFVRKIDLPVSYAWRSFGIENGANSLSEMRARIEKYRRISSSPTEDYIIGCIMLAYPFFFSESEYIELPSSWSDPIQQGKGYSVESEEGARIWRDVTVRKQSNMDIADAVVAASPEERRGSPQVIMPRKGQGIFRGIVLKSYNSTCAVTRERALPTLIAAHIQDFAKDGPNTIKNGILLRSDIHNLFDDGYVTISPDYHFEVSKRIKEDFDNGEEYIKLHGSQLYLPANDLERPNKKFIQWHNENRYKK
jgi:putative restriction endonuclease